jgi:type III secretion protein N (ATPase)
VEPRGERQAPGVEALDADALRSRLAAVRTVRAYGRVLAVTGLHLCVELPGARLGDVVVVRRGGGLPCEIVGVDGPRAVAMALGPLTGVGPGDAVESAGGPLRVRAGPALLGRVVDGIGRPLDGGPAIAGELVPVDRDPPSPLARRPIDTPFATGVRVLDALVTFGEGQRVGLFAAAGVGKSALLGAIARGAEADVVVVALVGERGREVADVVARWLGGAGAPARARTIVVAATSDVSAVERVRAAHVATAYAEHFRDRGARVLLLVDSLTRFARAQREVGLAAGEPPVRRGYPPSIFAAMPRLLERAGQGPRGSITAVYTVLVEGGDMDEPIADEARGLLDGHVVLDRGVAARGRFPAVDVPASLSRVMDTVVTPAHRAAARRVRALIAAHESKRDLLALGAYAPGADAELDDAIARMPAIERLLRQDAAERTPLRESVQALRALAEP